MTSYMMRTTGKYGRQIAVITILIFLLHSIQEGHCDDDVTSSCVKQDADVTDYTSACSTNVHVNGDTCYTNTVKNYFSTMFENICPKDNNMTYLALPADHSQTTLTHEKRSPGMVDDLTSVEISNEIASSVKNGAHNMLGEMLNQGFKVNVNKLLNDFLSDEEDATVQPEGPPRGEVVFEYPRMEQIKPVKAGHAQSIDIGDGTSVKLITLSLNPPLFEIPDFISNDDCDYIIEASIKQGLQTSRVLATENDARSNKDIDKGRVSNSTFIKPSKENVAFLTKLQRRAAGLLGVPVEVIRYSQALAIGQYHPGGFYHAHLDSNIANGDKPCCFQTKCPSINGTERENVDCCQVCRVASLLYYLDNVEEGGETAFPFADKSMSDMDRSMQEQQWYNLSMKCEEAAVRVKPQKGKAILWYNHFLDNRGYLGAVNKRGYHGGCDVKKGVKWIATHWVQYPQYQHRRLPSKNADDVKLMYFD